MDRARVESIIKGIIAERLNIQTDIINPEALIIDLGGDSLDVIELMMDYETTFGIEIPDEDEKEFRTLGSAVDSICKRLKIA